MILLLAGTAEARNLAGYLKDAGIDCIASLAGATRNPANLPVPTRHGGFGGAAGFEAYLDAENITAVIDATHPFAVNITARTAQICQARGMPYLRFERAVWRSRPGDTWHEAKDYKALGDLIPKGSRVFWAAGRQALADALTDFSDCGAFEGREVICRVIDQPSEPFPLKAGGFTAGSWAVGQPPFSESDEITHFEKIKPDWLVVKNAGGGAGRSKLDAARKLGIRVAMIARPEGPDGIERREQICDALEWAEDLELAVT